MLYRRGKNWWVRFTIRGREIRVTSGTDSRELAEEFEHRLREQVWREQQFGQTAYTWEEACERWLKEKAHKASLVRDKQAFVALRDHLSGRTLHEIDSPTAAIVAQALRSGRSPGTVNRIMAVARSVFRAAVGWGWITNAPKVGLVHVEKTEPRWITRNQFEALAGNLPPHLAAMARFAVATGLRWGNVSRLTWAMVDLPRSVATIPGRETKAGKAISVPLSTDAVAALQSQSAGAMEPASYVFTDQRGRAPVGSVKTAWLRAVKRSGLEGFRFHDLRHTWAAWHTLAGTPPIILKELGGWSSLAMVERYSALNPGHLADWAENSAVQKTAQPKRKAYKKRVKSKR